ncbi:MAG: hypothetical protein EOP21_12645 [Hyphomicrobiales bacterium]|nr:MAG: hypothetical protein EOP21_12645 [Hyphomicrobiales bacterium]
MGWRTDQAYEDAQKADHIAWKASLTWPQYLAAPFHNYHSALAGGAVAAVIVGTLWLLVG